MTADVSASAPASAPPVSVSVSVSGGHTPSPSKLDRHTGRAVSQPASDRGADAVGGVAASIRPATESLEAANLSQSLSQSQSQSQSPVAVGPLLGVSSTIADSETVFAAVDAAAASRLKGKGGLGQGLGRGDASSSSSRIGGLGRSGHLADAGPMGTMASDRAAGAGADAAGDASDGAACESNRADTGSSGSGSGSRRRIVANVPLVDLSHLGPDSGWRQHVTDDGLVYYSNDETGATTWDRPKCLGQMVLDEDADVVVMVGDAQATVREPSDPEGADGSRAGADVEALLPKAAAASGGAPEVPAAVSRGAEEVAGGAPELATQSARADSHHQTQDDLSHDQQRDLPELFHESYRGRNGWLSTTDEEGYVYYVHEPTGTTQWERPAGFA